jgi:prevent-host-death family protein
MGGGEFGRLRAYLLMNLPPAASADVAANFDPMTLHGQEVEVGVRELHDRLSEYLEKVEEGETIVVTRRGKSIARLSRVDAPRPLEEFERRGLVRWPKRPKGVPSPLPGSKGSISGLVSEQRR